MDEALPLATLITSVFGSGVATAIYARMRRLDTLVKLHCKRHPDDEVMLE